jgi:hypothetical protein
LCEKRVKSPSTQEFNEFHNPYEQVPHVHLHFQVSSKPTSPLDRTMTT